MASKIVVIIVFILDLIAVGLAIAAEQRRSVGKVETDREKQYEYCVYGTDIATSYGAGAFVLLFVSQVLIMVASRCFCCGKSLNPGGSRACAIILFLICWVFFLIAEMCLLAASIRNAYHTQYRKMWNVEDPPSCEVIRKGVFAAGAAFTLFTAIVSQFYYVCYSRARDAYQNPSY
ncbi:unnamed protein product [Arabidopsis lyrata]|uniref:Fiber protein Fb34 n=1 Tax=Arabidopsis lyrata subsp. lyrata TaxID=81972 RepID=D7L4U0_ARALL|nr:uncharacterized protein LOC9321156 [Arabidopsis lyrata subsp. lyrata]EFH61349.1 hypothetical protein ARALYDRAFT_897839 [Arabidopsis lyrata subsp. lyrata]CAH8260598.1 unnamed protein product [Arabidopsis lyrata]|eukprot:XP_002885090.1 uncharacterized protein LOC9321156 [Arabidopsis lyrata subsp. lyrata]